MNATLIVALLLALPAVSSAAQWQSLDKVRAVAEAFATQSTPGANVTAQAAPLDARLRLAACDAPLEAFSPPGARANGNTTVGVRCTGTAPWKLYLPVRRESAGQVLVARRPLARGARLTDADLQPVSRDLTRLPYGYFGDPADLVGRELRRPLAAGTVIVPSMIASPAAVRRGQSVTLLAQQAGVQISMTGKALMDGALEQRIRVRNLSSGRVVEGVVRSDERVEVLLQ